MTKSDLSIVLLHIWGASAAAVFEFKFVVAAMVVSMFAIVVYHIWCEKSAER